jgi:putative ATP-dependent endonuclease of the OLD family
MTDLKEISITIKGYKSFAAEGASFSAIKPINVVIGRNNSGKSALVDAIELACNRGPIAQELNHSGLIAQILFTKKLTEIDLSNIFPANERHQELGGVYGEHLVAKLKDSMITMELTENRQVTFSSIFPDLRVEYGERIERLLQRFQNRVPSPFDRRLFRRLGAERDIVAEVANPGLEIHRNGVGFSQAMANILNSISLPSSIVEIDMLKSLNQIMRPDAELTRIRAQRHENDRWEVMLSEQGKGEFSVSNSGSGLKTILLVLAFVECLPKLSKRPLSDFIFVFEELENNLHPALQRRLMRYLRDVAVDQHCTIFLTTHSAVVIDLFSHDTEAQLVHVVHDGKVAHARTVSTYVDRKGVLDDLDIRASDLLQANGIVWVEGPSDRLYFNRWMELFTEGGIQEGAHYQCVFYGGRLLAHLTGVDPDMSAEDAIKILRVNRNAIVLMDSDKKASSTPINDSKKRIAGEIEAIGGLAWVTKGREIENYLSQKALAAVYPNSDASLGQFQYLGDYIADRVSDNEATKFERKKALFAERVAPHLKLEDLNEVLDWKTRMTEVVQAVLRWNGSREN